MLLLTFVAVGMILPLAYFLLVDLAVGDEQCPVPGTDVTAHVHCRRGRQGRSA